jgi:hypothetical protein
MVYVSLTLIAESGQLANLLVQQWPFYYYRAQSWALPPILRRYSYPIYTVSVYSIGSMSDRLSDWTLRRFHHFRADSPVLDYFCFPVNVCRKLPHTVPEIQAHELNIIDCNGHNPLPKHSRCLFLVYYGSVSFRTLIKICH